MTNGVTGTLGISVCLFVCRMANTRN